MNNEVYTVELVQTIGIILYKFMSLAVGMFTTYLGYQLFLKGFLTEKRHVPGRQRPRPFRLNTPFAKDRLAGDGQGAFFLQR